MHWVLIMYLFSSGQVTKLPEQPFATQSACELKGSFEAEMFNTDPKFRDAKLKYGCYQAGKQT